MLLFIFIREHEGAFLLFAENIGKLHLMLLSRCLLEYFDRYFLFFI